MSIYQQRMQHILNDPAASFTLKAAVRAAHERDPVDACVDASTLAALQSIRVGEIYAAHNAHDPQGEPPRRRRFVVKVGRVVHEYETVDITVEAFTADMAELEALQIGVERGDVWDKAARTPHDMDEVIVAGIEEVPLINNEVQL